MKGAIKKIKIRTGHTKGMGFLSWDRLEKRLRQIGELTGQDELASVYLDEEGLYYTTKQRKDE